LISSGLFSICINELATVASLLRSLGSLREWARVGLFSGATVEEALARIVRPSMPSASLIKKWSK